jgi:predicted AAA+ superfamily ATPase
MEHLENAEYYMRAFESEQIIRRKLELECETLRSTLKEMVEKYETTIKIYTSLLAQKGLNFDLLDTSKQLTPEVKAIVTSPPPLPSPLQSPQQQQAGQDPEPSNYQPMAQEGF